MKKKRVLLMGGVGNRLFQLARATDLLDRGYHTTVMDIEDFGFLNFLAYRILRWTNHSAWVDIDGLCDELGIQKRKPNISDHFWFSIELFCLRFLGQRQKYNTPLETDSRTHQVGYFQALNSISGRSVFRIAEGVKKLLEIKDLQTKSAVVHIRAGDFSKADRISPDLVHNYFDTYADNCVCVTNDRGYVKDKFPFLKLSASNSPADDFREIAVARSVLPSNSTFCFWGCAIAVKLLGANLHAFPADSYWQHLARKER